MCEPERVASATRRGDETAAEEQGGDIEVEEEVAVVAVVIACVGYASAAASASRSSASVCAKKHMRLSHFTPLQKSCQEWSFMGVRV